MADAWPGDASGGVDRPPASMRLAVSVAIITSAAVMAVAPHLGLPSGLREALVLAYCLSVPGWSLGRLLHVHDIAVELTIALAVSMAVIILLAFACLELHDFRSGGIYDLDLCVAALGGAIGVMQP